MIKSTLTKTLILSASLLVACGPAPSSTTINRPSTPVPSASPAQSASPQTGTSPTVGPTSTVVITPTASVSPTSPAPLGSPSTPSLGSSSPMSGHVFDEDHNPIADATVTVRSLNEAQPFFAETTTRNGVYSFDQVPLGLQLEITASKKNFTTRKRVEVFSRSNDKPYYNFGTGMDADSTGSEYLGLSDRPEVVSITPARYAKDVEPAAPIQMAFSEPMDTKTVENNFAIRAFKNRKLTVDAGSSADTFQGTGDIANLNGTLIWNKEAFNIAWNDQKTKATFSFKDGRALPSDKELNLVPEYQVLFENDRVIKDITGISRTHHHFASINAPAEETVPFRVLQDTLSPNVSRIQATSSEGGSNIGDTIKVYYSEPMRLSTLSKTLGGGMDNAVDAVSKSPAGFSNSSTVTAEATAHNYTIKVTRNKVDIFYGAWGFWGGQAALDSSDPHAKTVLLTLPTQPKTTTTITAAPPNQAVISGSLLLENGETRKYKQLPLPQQTTLSSGHVSSGVNLTAQLIETLEVAYTDGVVEVQVDLPDLSNNVYQGSGSLQAMLMSLLASGNLLVTELQSDGSTGNNVVDTGDRVNFALQNNPTRTYDGKVRTVAWIKLSGGIFDSNYLNVTHYNMIVDQPKVLQASLNYTFDELGGGFVVSEGGNPDGIWQNPDTLTLTLSDNPNIDEIPVRMIALDATGALASQYLNIPGWKIFPGLQAGERPNVFQPGDEIWLEVLYSITDPAGNGMDLADATTPAG